MLRFFKKKKAEYIPLLTDIHSHLLPGLDDGVDTFEESIEIIEGFEKLGYQQLITTPHIMHDFYSNTEKDIKDKLLELNAQLQERQISIKVGAAAEYYLDDQLMKQIADSNHEFLTFGDNYLLFETSFMNEPFYINEFIFKAKSRGLNPILAHPERYAYIQSQPEKIDDLLMRGVLLQVNINSLIGYYSKQVKKIAEKLVENKQVHFLGSDCHNSKHFSLMSEALQEKAVRRALALPLLNRQL